MKPVARKVSPIGVAPQQGSWLVQAEPKRKPDPLKQRARHRFIVFGFRFAVFQLFDAAVECRIAHVFIELGSINVFVAIGVHLFESRS